MARWWRTNIPNVTLGLDLGDRTVDVCVLDEHGEVQERQKLRLGKAPVTKLAGRFEDVAHRRVVLEAGTPSPWVSRIFEAADWETIVANPSELYGGKRRPKRRNDKLDAERLARRGRADPHLLYPLRHRSERVQTDLAVIKARDLLVAQRAQTVAHVRGMVKSFGARLPGCSTEAFARKVRPEIPAELWPALGPLLEQVEALSARIKAYDQAIEALAEAPRYAEAVARVGQPKGVGTLTALTYVLVIDDPERFRRSRSVGQYLGLCPRLDESGKATPELPIHKAGDAMLRRLLVQAAHYVLGPFGPDTDLRRWGLRLAERGGRAAKKKAVVAVARKLAVLLHSLWVSGETYEPLRHARAAEEAERAEADGADGADGAEREAETVAAVA